MVAAASQRASVGIRISCPDPACGKAYEIARESLGTNGRQVRCPFCKTIWFQSPIALVAEARRANPMLSAEFPRTLKNHLNGLPEHVRRKSGGTKHAVRSFLMQEEVGRHVIGPAFGIKAGLPHLSNVEVLWDAAGKKPNVAYSGEDPDLTLVAESENQIDIERALDDAAKLPSARADVRLMFFRATSLEKLNFAFEKLRHVFERHKNTQVGDIYILAGMETRTLLFFVRKLTIRSQFSNATPWEEF
jgi:predicted Zn finger-like uncharacterized protein